MTFLRWRDKPPIQTVRYANLFDAIAYVEYQDGVEIKDIIVGTGYNNGEFTYLPCFDGRDDKCENPEWYEQSFIDAVSKLWALFPDESSSLRWEVSW